MKTCFVVLLAILVAVLISAVLGFVVMTLWNFIVPDLFSGPTVSFLQAWALWILLGLLGGLIRGK